MAKDEKKKDPMFENAPPPEKMPADMPHGAPGGMPGKPAGMTGGKKGQETEEEPTADELRQMMKKNNSEVRGPGAGRMIREKPKNLRETVGKLLRYIGKSKWLVFLIMLTTILTSVLNSIGPRLQGKAIDAITMDL